MGYPKAGWMRGGDAPNEIPRAFGMLLLSAALYSRTLATTGVTSRAQDFLLVIRLPILATMVLVWFVLGMIIDSISIMLLTVPIFEPLAVQLGYDPIAFAIVGILAD